MIDPRLQSLHLKLGRSITSKFLWSYVTKFKWQWLEFADIRSYVAGDPWKSIDRKSSAKKWELFIKEYVEERQLRVRFMSDILKSSPSRLDKLQEIEYALWYAALRNGDKIWALREEDDASVTRIDLSGKRESLRRIVDYHETDESSGLVKKLSHILFWSRQESRTHWHMDQVLTQMRLMNVHGSFLVIVTDQVDIDEKLLKALAQKNEIFWIHLFDHAEISLQSEDEWYVQFHWGNGSRVLQTMRENENTTIDAYKALLEKKTWSVKRFIRSIWWRYLQLDDKSDVVRELMRSFDQMW